MGTPQENPVSWEYPLQDVSEDRRASRTAVKQDFASELVGVDGNSEGGLRPFPGFYLYRELTPTVITTGVGLTPSFTGRSRLLDVQAVTFRMGSTGYGFGLVYRLTQHPAYAQALAHGTDADADVFFDYWKSIGPGWSTGNIVVKECSSLETMSVVVSNRLMYAIIRGRSPALFYLLPDSPYTLTKLGDLSTGPFPGPGLMPELTSPEQGINLGLLTSMSSPARPALGNVVLTNFLPGDLALDLDPSAGDCTGSNSDIIWIPAGNYAFSFQLYDSKTGRKSALSEIAFAQTNDWGGLGTAGSYAAFEILYDSSKFDQAYIYRSVRVEDAGGTYVAAYQHLDRIIDLSCYASNVSTTPPYDNSVYYIRLEDKQLVFQDYFSDRQLCDETMPKGGAAVMYGTTLLISNITGNGPSTSEEIRTDDAIRGLGELRWSSTSDPCPELFPPGNRYVPKTPSNDIIAFAELGGSVIGWSKDRQYLIRKDGQYMRVQEIHEGFGITGPAACAVVGSMAYFLTPKGLKSVNADGQLDDVKVFNYVVMEQWDPEDLEDVYMAYDAQLSALFILNPSEKHMLVLWFNTGKATELIDCPFSQVGQGSFPIDLTTDSSSLVERAFFVQDSPDHATGDTFLPDWKPRVYLADSTLLKTGTLGRTLLETDSLVPTGQANHTNVKSVFITSGVAASQTVAFVANASNVVPRAPEGAYLYVLASSTASFVGLKSQVYYKSSNSYVMMDAALDGLPAGSTVAISPVYFRWVGHPVGMQAEDGTSQGSSFHRIKQVESLNVAMTDTAGSQAGTTNAAYRGLIYRGSDETPLTTASPLDKNDLSTIVNSVKDREGTNACYFKDPSTSTTGLRNGVVGNCLTPGIEIFCPNLDFRVLSVLASGKILGTERSRNST